MPALSDFDLPGLQAVLAERGFPRAHAQTLLRAFYAGAEIDLGELQTGKRLSQWIDGNIALRQSRVVMRHASADGTSKFLIAFDHDGAVEAVFMPSHRPERAAACISSQIGCAMGCDFCASTRNGLERNLTAGEIVEQFVHVKRHATACGRRIASLVFMGMGEPLQNIENLIRAIHRIATPGMGELGYRAITVSTVGVVPGIDRLTSEDLGLHLALSLHAPDDETRSKLVPPNRRWRVREILDAARRFQDRTGRVVNIEYCLLADVNDSDAQARLLAELLGDWRVHVNLIPHNSIGAGLSGTEYRRPSEARIEGFQRILRAAGIVTHRRVTRGDDIAAACGQLRQTMIQPLVQLNPRSAIGVS